MDDVLELLQKIKVAISNKTYLEISVPKSITPFAGFDGPKDWTNFHLEDYCQDKVIGHAVYSGGDGGRNELLTLEISAIKSGAKILQKALGDDEILFKFCWDN